MALVKAENVSNQFTGLGGLPFLRQLGLMIGLAASVAIGVALVLWSQTPSYRLLYSNLNTQDVSQVVTSLQQAGIEYKHDEANGTVWVDGAMVHDARMRLASQGLPQGSGAGFEMLDNQDGFGSSQFIESVRYQRALEGELARTISTMNTVQSARVHLAVPKQSVFVRNRKKPSASVVLTMFPGRSLEPGQIQAIVNLVGSSVPDLEARMITVVDQRGKLLTDDADGDMAFSAKQLDYKHDLEKSYVKRIENILTPIVGSGKVKAQVNTELDFTVTEKTQELFNPDQAAVRSEQTVEEGIATGENAGGVPGALTNQPPEEGQLADGEAATAQEISTDPNNSINNSRRRSVRNFEVDKTISHTRLATGTIRRLSVAVLVDDKVTNEGSTPYTEEELLRFTTLIRDAVGFNAQRGDSVNVVNAPFTVEPEPEPLPEEPIWQQAWVWNIAKQVLAGLAVLFLIFGVLKPVMRELASKGVEFKNNRNEADTQERGDEQLALGGQEVAQQLTAPIYESHIQTAGSMVDQDPKTVAQVLKNWVATDGG